MWAARSEDHERACVEGSRASVRVNTAASDDQSIGAVAERQDSPPSVSGILALEEAVLGPASILWARGYFCCSSGNVTDEVIAKYIAEQNTNVDEDFKVDG